MKKFISILSFICFGLMVNAQITDLGVQMKHGSTKIVDFNKDGHPDIIVTGEMNGSNRNFRIFQNNGDGTYTSITHAITAATWGQLLFDDYNSDGELDMLLTGETAAAGTISRLYAGVGDGTFIQVDTLSKFTGTRQSCFADFNNDGRADIALVPHNGANVCRVFFSNSDGTLTPGDPFSSTVQIDGPTSSALDLDNDGFVDIFIAGWRNNFLIQFWKNNGDGTFTEKAITGIAPTNYGSSSWADYDGDGLIDLLINGNAGNYAIFHNDGNLNFTKAQTLPYNCDWQPEGSSKFVDWDNDGDYDIVITGNLPSRFSKIFLNNGGVFAESAEVLTPLSVASVDAYDMDGDQKADLVISGENSAGTGVCFVYKNSTANVNTLPAPPAILNFDLIDSTTAVFIWEEGSDIETPVKALSYNIYLKNTTTGRLVVSPKADTISGKRFVSDFGNAYLNKRWIVKGLKWGEFYEVGVQSIDASYSGSVFTKYKFKVKFVAKVKTIYVYRDKDVLEIGDSLQVKTAVLPLIAEIKECDLEVVNLTGEATIDSVGILKAIKPGVVNVIATAKDGSGTTGEMKVTILEPLKIDPITGAKLNAIYPNPTNGLLNIHAKLKPVAYKVIDMNGRVRTEKALISSEQTFDITSLPKGIYFIQMIYKGSTETYRIIKK